MIEKEIKVKAYRDHKWLLLQKVSCEPILHAWEAKPYMMAGNQEARLPRIQRNGEAGQRGHPELFYMCLQKVTPIAWRCSL